MNSADKQTSGPIDPWNERSDWAQKRVDCGSGEKPKYWLGAIMMSVVIISSADWCWRSWNSSHDWTQIAFPLLFSCCLSLVVLWAILKGIRETIRLRRFGTPELELNTVPIPLGGTVEGRIQIKPGADKAPEFTIILACIRRQCVVSLPALSKQKQLVETVLWSVEKKATLLPGGILPVSMPVPTGQPGISYDENTRSLNFWRLTVNALFPGASFLQKYDLPIFDIPSHSGKNFSN